MKKIIVSYKKLGLLALLLALVISGCSERDKIDSDEKLSGAQETADENAEAEIIPEEIIPEESKPEESKSKPEPDATEAVITEVNWENYFDGINGSAVIYNPSDSSYQIYNPEMALTQRSPCSTFKIISSLIALENGVITPENSVREWSGEVFWNEDWNRDIDFENAFRTSCVWYYRRVIDEMGEDMIQEALDSLQYGNCDISDWQGYLNTNNSNRSLTGFWIESSLKISPKEQTEVMERIFGENSAFSQETQEELKHVMLLTEANDSDALIYGKTGMGKADGVVVDAWYTGFSDMAQERIYFCIYLGETAGKNVSSTKAKEIAVTIISDLEKTQ